MSSIIKRNLKIFFRDRGNVFFSLLSVFVIIGLYVFFLKDSLISGYEAIDSIETLINTWVMAGIMAVVSITTTLGAFGTMVRDKAGTTLNDFYSSPISKKAIAAGYIISAFIIGVIMSCITFLVAQLYLYSSGDILFSFEELAKIFAIILLSVLAGSSMMFFIVTFLKTTNSHTTVSIIIGTLIGFITGVYIPIGSLPETVQNVVKVFPTSHSSVLFKSIFMKEPLATAFADAPASALETFSANMGITYTLGGTEISLFTSVLILLGTAAVFYLLAVLNLNRKQT